MDLTISRPIKIFALVAVVAMVGGMSMLMLKPKPSAAPPVVVSKSGTAAASKTATTTATVAAAPKTTTSASSHTVTTHTVVPPANTTAPKTTTVVGANGLPSSIDALFVKHAIVVVSVFDPQSSTDSISYAEAKAGATDAKAGFIGVSLLDSPLAAALTSALPGGGLLPAPGVLIYRRPGTLVQRLDGFTDRDVVAQAAAASVTADPITGSPSSGS